MTRDQGPTFRWLERGEGAPVVLLHGLMGTMEQWMPTLDVLAHSMRAVAPALPLFDTTLAEASVRGLASWVMRFLDALEMPRAVLGGNSLGGHVALETALAHPDRVAGLVLTGSSGLFERTFTRGVPRRPSPAYVRERMEEIFYDPAFVTPEWVDAVHGFVTKPIAALRLVRLARAAKHDNLERRLPGIRVPTLIVWGRDDRITPLGVAGRFQHLIPDSDLVILRECGHAPMLEQPHAFAAVVRAWLEDRDLCGHATLLGSGG